MDWFSKDYYSQRASDNPTGPATGTDRVFRGGGWGDSERNCRSALRSADKLTYRSPDLGFRIEGRPEMAMRVLRARLYQKALDERRAEEEKRVGDKKAIEWGSQIRSYVLHPYRMVKDHRTGHETGDTDRVLDGGLTPFVEAFLKAGADSARSAAEG